MTKAHELYMEAGSQKVAAPVNFPDELRPIVVFMELDVVWAPKSLAPR